MRPTWIALALVLAGCETLTLTLNPPPLAGGGGGAVPSEPAFACPVDFAAELERAIAAVPDRLNRDALLVQWRLIDRVANGTGHRERESAVKSFEILVRRLEDQGELAPAEAARLRGLARCYAW